jgi:hypothetical protein
MRRHRAFLKIFSFLVLLPFCLRAQEEKAWSGFGIETNLIAGKVLKHSAKFRAPIPTVSTALDMNFIFQTYGRKSWERRRKFPIVGLGIIYTNYGIDSVYGRCVGVYPNLQFYLVRGKRLEWTIKIGDGAGYVTRRYSRTTPVDTLNDAIGSHLNDFAVFMTDVRYRINEHFDVQLGANFTHISDASFRQPNLGVNMYGAHIGLRYFPVTSRPKRIETEEPKLTNRWLVEVRPAIAYDQLGAPRGPLYPVYMASAYASRRWHNLNKMFAGIDYSYHTSIYAFQRNNEINVGNEGAHSWKSAIFVGNEFLYGRVGIMLQIGVYIHEAYLRQDAYYEKLGGNFYLVRKEHGPIKEFFLSGLLKTHKSVAELAEFGLGMGF